MYGIEVSAGTIHAVTEKLKPLIVEWRSRALESVYAIVYLDAMNYKSREEGRVVRNQLSKSGTSVGANYREANRARSKADFRNKIAICETEASETKYWLEVIAGLGWKSWDELQPRYDECRELLAIFTSIGKK